MMQTWEMGLIGFFTALVALVGGTDVLPYGVLTLLDSYILQFLFVVVSLGLLWLSPIVGFASAIAFALIYVLRNRTIAGIKLKAPLPEVIAPESIQIEMRTFDGTSEMPAAVEPSAEEAAAPEGQYPIDTTRPTSNPVVRKLEYTPFSDMGNNEFSLVGSSIDEKGMIPASIQPWTGGRN